jgi:hypothetical protein
VEVAFFLNVAGLSAGLVAVVIKRFPVDLPVPLAVTVSS